MLSTAARCGHRDRPLGHHDGQRGIVSRERAGAGAKRAEVVYRASYPHPATGNEIFEIQSWARALDNNIYILAPELGDVLSIFGRKLPQSILLADVLSSLTMFLSTSAVSLLPLTRF